MGKLEVFAVGTLPLLVLIFTAGCGSDDKQFTLDMAPLAEMPREVQQAPEAVRESYQFALANSEILERLPCYCGCGGMGHTSNYSCYANRNADGTVRFDGHALGCSICVDITLDAMRMLKSGRELSQIRAYVDAEYSKYGPSNMPQPDASVPLVTGD